MTENCFFCDIQKKDDKKRIAENEFFFSRYDDFPVSKGHAEVIAKQHVLSFFSMSAEQAQHMYSLIKETAKILQKNHKPDGFNIGVNEGEAAGQTVMHLHVHLIPRYQGDTGRSHRGIRNIFPEKADYVEKAKNSEN